MTELEVLDNFKLFLIENDSEDADQISKITQKIEEISKS